jgi:translocation and assembly module TamB
MVPAGFAPEMPLGKRQRKLFLALGIFFGVLLIICFSVPLWFPWLLRPLATRKGVQYTRYEREGYRRFSLYQAGFTNGPVGLHAERVEVLTPTAWLWRTATGRGGGPWVRVDGWQLETLGAASSGAGQAVPSLYTNVHQIARALPTLERWLPAATLSNGTVKIQNTLVDLPAVTWSKGKAWAKVGVRDHHGTLSLKLGKTFPYELQLQSESLHLQATMQLTTNAEGLLLRSRSLLWSNRVDLQAQFGFTGLMPEQASVQVPNLRIAPQWLGLDDYYRELRGSVSGAWEHQQFQLSLTAAARPLTSQTNVPPVQIEVRASGDTNLATIQVARITSPWLQAELSRDLLLHFSGQTLREPATLKITADLSRQTWFPLEGNVRGQAEVSPGAGKFPLVSFELTGVETGTAVLKARTALVQGSLSWPWLEIAKADLTFEEGGQAAVRGRLDITNRALADASLEFKGALENRWLPVGWQVGSCELSAEVHGPLKSLSHTGRLAATNLSVPRVQPLRLEVDWQGVNGDFQKMKVGAAAARSSLSADGSAKASAAGADLLLNSLRMDKRGSNVLELKQPVQISINRARDQGIWRIESGLFDWSGNGAIRTRFAMEWPARGSGMISVRDLHSDLFQDFFRDRAEVFVIHQLEANVGWTNGPAVFGVDLRASGLAESGFPLLAEANLHSDGRELLLSNLVVTTKTSSVAVIHGKLPVTFNPAATNVLAFDLKAPLELKAVTTPKGVLWDKLAEWTGLVLREPDCHVDLSGTWAAPVGEIQLRARQIQLRHAKAEIPSLENLQVEIQFDRERARLTDGRVRVQGQSVTLTGDFPLGEQFWTGLRQKRVPSWEKASAHLRIENAQLAAFSPLLPEVLSPQGDLNLDLSLVPGGKVDGQLSVRKARTRPLGNLGPIRDIAVDMKFTERTLQLARASANIGGADVTASGKADLRDTSWLKGVVPPFQFALQGTNVPLSRQPESIIRSDLDLAVIKTNDAPAVISGTVRLRNSFYLRDVRDLVPGTVLAPGRRPPYFSIDSPPVADWRLATRVTGTRFLRIRSTLFSGEISANLKLEGTLKDPVALGDLRIDSGTVRFPFASLAVRQGFVTLGSSDPHRPQLEILAESKKFGYELRMEASGPADAPVVQFSSTPPLSSEQIVLMVTAGEMPKGMLTLTSQQKAQTVAVFFGRDLLARLGLGDEGDERLTFQSGEQVSEQGRPTYNLEYKLTKRWSLVGEYDRFNAFNAGLKWRVYSK